jgi:hypothetical protein
LIFRALVEQATCKSGAQTLDGGRSSNMRIIKLSTSPITRFLMSQDLRMKKVAQLVFKTTMEEETRNGKFYTLIKLIKLEQRVSTKISDSISIDHSILDLDFQ